MNTHQAPLSIKIIYWFTNLALVLLSLVFMAALVFNLVLNTTDFFGDDMQLHTNFPVEVDFQETGYLYIDNQEVEVAFVEAIPRIHFINTPKSITKTFGWLILVVVILGGFITWCFRNLLKNVKEGHVFTHGNIKLLKNLAYGLAGLWLFNRTYNWIFYFFIARRVEFENIRITENVQKLDMILAMAAFIWVLAHIFKTGLKLQEEKDLTI